MAAPMVTTRGTIKLMLATQGIFSTNKQRRSLGTEEKWNVSASSKKLRRGKWNVSASSKKPRRRKWKCTFNSRESAMPVKNTLNSKKSRSIDFKKRDIA